MRPRANDKRRSRIYVTGWLKRDALRRAVAGASVGTTAFSPYGPFGIMIGAFAGAILKWPGRVGRLTA